MKITGFQLAFFLREGPKTYTTFFLFLTQPPFTEVHCFYTLRSSACPAAKEGKKLLICDKMCAKRREKEAVIKMVSAEGHSN